MEASASASAAEGSSSPAGTHLSLPLTHRSPSQQLKEIAIDYCPESCDHKPEDAEIAVTYDLRGGARWRTTRRFSSGTFTAKIKTPAGNTNGLNCSFYLSSLEGDKSQDEIDFEFLGKDKGILQSNYYTAGTGNREVIHLLGFDSSLQFHEYTIKWFPSFIEWLIDGKVVRRVERSDCEDFPSMPMFLYASVWNASEIDDGKWAGKYIGCDEPYICRYKDVLIPAPPPEESLRKA